jgi:hypothetical protein
VWLYQQLLFVEVTLMIVKGWPPNAPISLDLVLSSGIELRPLLLTLHQLKIVADDAQDLALMSLSLELPPESPFGLASIQVYRNSHT